MGQLENSIHFNHTLQHVDQTHDTVTATFANGAIASGDMLVAADGIDSVVRRQLLPHIEPIDTGMRCIYGTTPLTTDLLDSLPDIFLSGFVPFAGPDRRTLAIGIFRPRTIPSQTPHSNSLPPSDSHQSTTTSCGSS